MPSPDRVSLALIRQAENMQLPLTALEAIVAIRRCLDELERDAVDGALGRGATWQMIADTLGVTKQAANQRLRKQRVPAPNTEAVTTVTAIAAEPPIA
jgi:hypothetical protein